MTEKLTLYNFGIEYLSSVSCDDVPILSLEYATGEEWMHVDEDLWLMESPDLINSYEQLLFDCIDAVKVDDDIEKNVVEISFLHSNIIPSLLLKKQRRPLPSGRG